MPRHHVRRQGPATPRRARQPCRVRRRRRRGGDHVGREPVVADDHRRSRDPGDRAEHGLDLGELDAVAAHLDLGVEPAVVLQPSVGGPADPVAGAVEPLAGRAGQVGAEPLGREVGTAPVAQGDPGPADPQLAVRPGGDQLPGRVRDEQAGVVERGAEVDPGGGVDGAGGRPDRRLRRSVDVDQARHPRREEVRELRRQRLPTAQHPQAGVALPAGLAQHRPGRRGGLHPGGRRRGQVGRQLQRVAADRTGADDHPAARHAAAGTARGRRCRRRWW